MSDSRSPAWTVRQVAEYPSVDVRSVSRMAEGGGLPAIEVGDAWQFRRDVWTAR